MELARPGACPNPARQPTIGQLLRGYKVHGIRQRCKGELRRHGVAAMAACHVLLRGRQARGMRCKARWAYAGKKRRQGGARQFGGYSYRNCSEAYGGVRPVRGSGRPSAPRHLPGA